MEIAGICLPGGILGTYGPGCIYRACTADGDCTAEAGGRCELGFDPCSGLPYGLVCSYPSDGCRTNADCTGGYCSLATTTGRARCVPGQPKC
jgi:hypothetical protein